MADMRNKYAALFAEGWVLELISRAPEIGPDSVDLRQVDSRETEERITDIEARLVVAELVLAAGPRKRALRLVVLSRESVQKGLDFLIAVLDLALDRVEQLEILSKDEQVLGAIVAGERPRDLPLGARNADRYSESKSMSGSISVAAAVIGSSAALSSPGEIGPITASTFCSASRSSAVCRLMPNRHVATGVVTRIPRSHISGRDDVRRELERARIIDGATSSR
jgi:hypothetical protein